MKKVVQVSRANPTGSITPRMRVITRKSHHATFNATHNASKSKVLIMLHYFKNTLHDNSGLDARELYLHTGVGYNYLLARLPKWAEWKYVLRHSSIGTNGKPVWHYKIAARGERFISERLYLFNRTMYQQYVSEIKDFNSIVEQMQPPAYKYKSMKSLIEAVNKEVEASKQEQEEEVDDEEVTGNS